MKIVIWIIVGFFGLAQGVLAVSSAQDNGKMKLGGQHLALPERTPIANLHLTLLQKVGLERDHFGDSTGTIAGV